MNGWNTIKKVRIELSEAVKAAKDGNKTVAAACLKHANLLLELYLEETTGPEYGFEAESLGS